MRTTGTKRRIWVIFSGTLLLAAGVCGCSGHQGHGPGQGQPPSKEQLFNQYDRDKDGRLSREEFPGPDDHFTQFDRNEDGYLEMDEVPDGPPSRKRRG